jgi:hypothetical protein
MRGLLLVLWGCGAQYDGANRIFVTSSVYTGDFGGAAAGDAICQQHAHDAGLDGKFIAWLGTADTNPVTRLSGSRGWVRVDGVPIADQSDALVTKSALAPVALDEHGRDVRNSQPQFWTGTHSDGTFGSGNCTDWTGGPGQPVDRGNAGAGGIGFLNFGVYACETPARLLCTEIGRSVPVSIAPAAGRLAFVSAAPFVVGGGIGAADALCASEAATASLPGSYLALLPQIGVASASRFDLAGAPWLRLDGALLASTAADLMSAQLLDNFINQSADGSHFADSALFWTELDPLDPSANSACGNWTDATAPTVVYVGNPYATDYMTFFGYTTTTCSDTNIHLLCLEQ